MKHSTTNSFTHTIAIAHVIQILQGAIKQGLDTTLLLQRSGITPALLQSPKARVTQAQYAKLIQTLRYVTKDELWGLCESPLPLGSFVHICQHIIHCTTLGQAIEAGIKTFRLLQPSLQPRFIIEENLARIHVPYPNQSNAAVDYAIRTFCFFTYGLMSWLVARPVPLVCFAYPKNYKQTHTEAGTLLRTQVRYQAAKASIEIEKKWLDLPIAQTLHSLDDFIRGLPSNLLIRYRNQSTTAERVRRILRKHHHYHSMPNLTEVSQHLGVSTPTLRRHLHQEGINFQAIKDAVRRDLAISYLQNSHLNLNDIALHLGFSEPSTFHRAFKSWTGVTPGFYRQHNTLLQTDN